MKSITFDCSKNIFKNLLTNQKNYDTLNKPNNLQFNKPRGFFYTTV